MADAEHAGQVVSNFVLLLVTAVHLVDKLVESLNDGGHVDLVLLEHPFSDFISHITVDILACGNQVLLDTG